MFAMSVIKFINKIKVAVAKTKKTMFAEGDGLLCLTSDFK
jgi:hypothetical protein